MRASSVSSSLPAAPTNGSPCRSSLKPGASPTIIRSAGQGPTPGTACVRVASRPQLLHDLTVSWSRISSWGALSDFDSTLGEGDVLARLAHRLLDSLQLLIGERHSRKPERTRSVVAAVMLTAVRPWMLYMIVGPTSEMALKCSYMPSCGGLL